MPRAKPVTRRLSGHWSLQSWQSVTARPEDPQGSSSGCQQDDVATAKDQR